MGPVIVGNTCGLIPRYLDLKICNFVESVYFKPLSHSYWQQILLQKRY